MKLFIILTIFINLIHAKTLIIDDKEINFKEFIFEYFQDKEKIETIATMQNKNFTETIENKKTLHSKNSTPT